AVPQCTAEVGVQPHSAHVRTPHLPALRTLSALPPSVCRYALDMLLAGDVGGTKTLIGLFQPAPAGGAKTSGRPQSQVVRAYAALGFNSLDDIVSAFLDETSAGQIDAVSIGVAGPVTGHRARLTNVPWLADISVVSERLHDCPALLLNDLEAMASAIPEL